MREGSETVRCLLPWPAGTSRAREMVRKKSAHAKSKGWDRVGANQVLMNLCDRRHVEQNDGAERVERSTCDGNRARSAAAVTVVCGASSAVKRVSATRAEATSSHGGARVQHRN